ncbi:ribosomal RNA small subunit methyltransferase I-like [Oratosquilla oratoria]|uniref:ribosomal RNA small subunit methyltransferase I-like n=1 Tax=Oratosquilla oratoria TaxID=337810 RepID=UPI003F771450
MKRLSDIHGSLYVIATPIGNFSDLSARAAQLLKEVDGVYAEDTRTSQALFREIGCNPAVQSLHEHNELERAKQVVKRLQGGESLALISDAGTPLISDPGYRVVAACHDAGVPVVPVPGACALVAALSVSGLPTDHFCFEGFLPARSGPRQKRLTEIAKWPHTLVFYESPHRIEATLADMVLCFGADRPATMAREISKRFETIRRSTLAGLAEWVAEDSNQRRGEVVFSCAGRA